MVGLSSKWTIRPYIIIFTFFISTYVQVHLIFVIWRKCKLLHLKEIFPFDLCFRTTVSLSDTGEAAQLLYGLLSFILKKLSLETTHFLVPCVTVSQEVWYYLFSSCATVSYSFPSSGTPWFDPWPATLQTWSVSIWTTLQITNFENQIIMLISLMIISQIIMLISLLRRNGFPCVVPHMLPLGSKLPNYKSCFPN